MSASLPAPHWVRAWGASPSFLQPSERVAVEQQTLRQTVMVTHAGQQLRLRFSNLFGAGPLTIGEVTVMPAGQPQQQRKVSFDHHDNVTVPAGAPVLSDAVAMPVKAQEVLEVSIYLPERTLLSTIHADELNHTTISTPGDFTSSASFEVAADTPLRPFLSGIDVLPSTPTKVVVAFGDSITDTHCKIGVELCRWSDVLAARLQAAGKNYAVANEAISGNRVLLDGYGPGALARFDRDVLAVPGVTHLVVLEGINDIGNSGGDRFGIPQPVISAQSLIAGYQQIIARAHEHGIKVIGCTMTPFAGAGYYSPEKERVRKAVNDWIRHAGAFDGVVDFASVVRDPNHPDRLLPSLDRGGHLHPNGAGQRAMGKAIDLDLF
ncbi:MAG TPA: SGNH/GDSL hydrolase family protein [Rhodanobacter sp.]|nr:SGNH/GDSL hydrolase family protein [Rhodanobacter sp.]